jgi:hypothetical protein
MTNYSAGHRACLCDNEELGHIDYAGEHARLGVESISAELYTHEIARFGNQRAVGEKGIRTIIIMTQSIQGKCPQMESHRAA